MTLRLGLALAALLWPLTLGAALVDHLDNHPTMAATVVYVGASRICHRDPDRSFFIDGHQWPVCGRCSGLYLSAPIGALWAWRPRVSPDLGGPRTWLVLAALPTAVTVVIEWLLVVPVPSAARFLAAVPLGAVIAAIIVRASSGIERTIR